MTEASAPAGGRGRRTLSNLFAALAVVFAVIAIVLFARDRRFGVAPVPTAAPGGSQIVNVVGALERSGLSVAQPPGSFIPKGALAVPGQGVEIDGNPGFIFLYESAAAAVADAATVAPDAVVPERVGKDPAPPGQRRMVQGSNVILLMIGGSDQTWQKVESAITMLP